MKGIILRFSIVEFTNILIVTYIDKLAVINWSKTVPT